MPLANISRRLGRLVRYPAAPLVVLLITWGGYLALVFSRMVVVNTDGLTFGHENVWSDWALHVGLARLFATRPSADWFFSHPIFVGAKLSYPFAADLISGLLLRGGVSLYWAFIGPSILTGGLLLVGLYRLLAVVTRRAWLPVGVISLYFLTSGLGGLAWISELTAHPTWSLLTYPPRQYGRFDIYQWYSGNVLTGLIIPQRAFLLGLTAGVWILWLVLDVIRRDEWQSRDRWRLLAAGGLAGLMPIIHPHSLIVVVAVSAVAVVATQRHWKMWLWYILPAALLGSALYLIFISGAIRGHFLSWLPFYGAGDFWLWLVEWWRQWGLLLPVAFVAASVIRPRDRLERIWLGGLTIMFIVGQFWLFQPVKWDNSKVFFWSALGFCLLAAQAIAGLGRRGLAAQTVAALLIVGLTATGVLELIQLARIDRHSYTLLDTDDLAFGRAVTATSPRAVFLTAPIHHSPPAVWGGRTLVLGYEAWAWNYGLDYEPRRDDVASMYRGGPAAVGLLARYGVGYVVFGPEERDQAGTDETFYADHYPIFYQSPKYKVYTILSSKT